MSMSSSHLLDPRLRPLVEAFALPSWGDQSLPGTRAFMQAVAENTPLPDLPVDVRQLLIPSPEGHDIPVILYQPRDVDQPMPAVLQLHGGGYVAGSASITGPGDSALANDLRCMVVAVDYRLSPEAAYPAALNDCYDALLWLYREAPALNVDRTRLAVSGASAGGGLAAGLALRARDQGEVSLCGQVLIYPMLDDRTGCVVPAHPLTGEYIWDAASNVFAWTAYLGTAPGADVVGYSVPGRYGDLANLPPALIAVGQLDLFFGEVMAYAQRLIEAGVSTELHVYPGACHAFDLMAEAPASIAYARAQRDWLAQRFATGREVAASS